MRAIGRYVWVLFVVLMSALVARGLEPYFNQANVVMVYMLGVVIASFYLGLWPGVTTALLSVPVFDFVNLPPQFVFTGGLNKYWIMLSVMSITAATIAVLADRLRAEANESRMRELRVAALYSLSADLADAESPSLIVETTCRHIADAFHASVTHPAFRDDNVTGPVSEPLIELREPLPDTAHPDAEIRVVGTRQNLGSEEQVNQLRAMARLSLHALEREALRQQMKTSEIRLQRESLRNSMLGSLSHDLRTPLATIMGATSELLDVDAEHDAESRQQLAEAVMTDVVEMQRMIDNLLDLARLRSGDAGLVSEWQAIEEIVGSAISSLGRWYPRQQLVVEVPADLPMIRCDGVLIERVIVNLVENAVRHSQKDAPIALSSAIHGDWLELRVIDHGPGIPVAEREAIFDATSRERRRTGGGLGLTICRGIVDAHAGNIRIDDTPGGGATFVISLPLPSAPPDMHAAENMPESA